MKIIKIIIGSVVALFGLFSFVSPVFGDFNLTGGGTYRLQTSAGSTDTTIRLSSFKEPISNIPYTMNYINSVIQYGTLDPQQSNRREFISFTGITQNTDGTASLTGVTRGLSGSYPYTASSTLRQAHSGQSIFILSDAPQIFNQFANRSNAQTITGVYTFASTAPAVYDGAFTVSSSSLQIPYASWIFNNFVNTSAAQIVNGLKTFASGIYATASSTFSGIVNVQYSTASSSPATVGYANALAVAGAPNADTSTKGIVEEATISEINSGASIGGTGAKLFMTPATFAVSNFASTTVSRTLIPQPLLPIQGSVSSISNVASTTAYIGMVNFNSGIYLSTAVAFAIQNLNAPAALLQIGLFRADGTQVFTATSSTLGTVVNATSNKTVPMNLSAQTFIAPGNYYIAIVPRFSNSSTAFLTWNTSNISGPVGYASTTFPLGGTLTVSNTGFMPTTITPSSIATSTDQAIPIVRLDN